MGTAHYTIGFIIVMFPPHFIKMSHCQATKINPVYWRRVTSIWMCEKPTRQDLWWLQEKKIPSTEIEFTESLEMLVKAIYLKKVFHEQESLESLISVWILLVKTPVETRTFKYPMEKIINIKVSVLSDAVSNGCDSGGDSILPLRVVYKYKEFGQ